jgi:exodeoxyribonuclease III
MDQLLTSSHWLDAFRIINQEGDQYTLWSNRGQAWAKNVGWRIDYQIISAALEGKITATSVYKRQETPAARRLIVDYDIKKPRKLGKVLLIPARAKVQL